MTKTNASLMNSHLRLLRCAVAAVTLFGPAVLASDHADPMSPINPFKLQDDPVANITDLHAFVADTNGAPILTEARLPEGDQLVVSLCVRRRLLPWQIPGLSNDVPRYSFRVHLDLNPDVRVFDSSKTRDGRDYQSTLNRLNALIATGTSEAAAASRQRSTLIEEHERDQAAQDLYGGIIRNPSTIAEEAILDFQLAFNSDGENSEVSLSKHQVEGIAAEVNVVSNERRSLDGEREISRLTPRRPDRINVQCGIFDDPFIFPRFFRGNVIGIVTSIPLRALRPPQAQSITNGPILIWATTHLPNGQQSDHVGRSLRTQLPRFGYLNGLHPSRHVAEIQRVHDRPDLLENILATFIAPLEAHRHYDNVPDVMVFDLRKPAKFPNGRWFADDVAKTLADAGETLLLELSVAESRQYPRSTINDKPFSMTFPYLAPRWTTEESNAARLRGSTLDEFMVPAAPDNDAIALPDLHRNVWANLWLSLSVGLLGVGVPAFWAGRGLGWRSLVVGAVVLGLFLVRPISAPARAPMDPAFMRQPGERLLSVILGGGMIGLLGLAALYQYGIRRGRALAARDARHINQGQEYGQSDQQYTGSSFDEVKSVVMSDPYYSRPWGAPGQGPLPVEKTTLWDVAQGLFSRKEAYHFFDAASRTLESHSDLRRGPDGTGVRRLLHPNGVCLFGNWEITETSDYTGYFATGSRGLIIGRYSSGLAVARGQARTLSLVGKIYPTLQPGERNKTASFITQEDLGAAYSRSIDEAVLRNAPNVSLLRRRVSLGTLVLTVLAFLRVDRRVMVRQLYEIAELNKPKNVPTRCPEYMELRVVKRNDDLADSGDGTSDFRDEVLSRIYRRGVRLPEHELQFDVFVADHGKFKGLLNRRLEVTDWKRIGRITFNDAVTSRSGDRVIHFHHPKWRENVNVADTAVGPTEGGRFLNWLINGIKRLNKWIG